MGETVIHFGAYNIPAGPVKDYDGDLIGRGTFLDLGNLLEGVHGLPYDARLTHGFASVMAMKAITPTPPDPNFPYEFLPPQTDMTFIIYKMRFLINEITFVPVGVIYVSQNEALSGTELGFNVYHGDYLFITMQKTTDGDFYENTCINIDLSLVISPQNPECSFWDIPKSIQCRSDLCFNQSLCR